MILDDIAGDGVDWDASAVSEWVQTMLSGLEPGQIFMIGHFRYPEGDLISRLLEGSSHPLP